MLLSLIVALAAFFGSLGIASKYLESVADRIAPDLKAGMKAHRPEKVGATTLLRRLAQVIAILVVLALWIRGPVALRYGLAAVVTLTFFIDSYALRLRPVFARGATPKERAVLFMLNVAGALSLGYLLLWSAWQGHAG